MRTSGDDNGSGDEEQEATTRAEARSRLAHDVTIHHPTRAAADGFKSSREVPPLCLLQARQLAIYLLHNVKRSRRRQYLVQVGCGGRGRGAGEVASLLLG